MNALFVTAAVLELTANASTPQPTVICKTEIRERGGLNEAFNRCRDRAGTAGPWACYQDVVERCTEATGRLTQREYRHWTGTCTAIASDCGIPNGRSLESNPTASPGLSVRTAHKVSEALTANLPLAPVRPPSDAGWFCEDMEIEKSSRLDVEHGVCGRTGDTAIRTPWACSVVVEHRCRERYSGQERTSRERRFLGCVESFGDCR